MDDDNLYLPTTRYEWIFAYALTVCERMEIIITFKGQKQAYRNIGY